MSTRILMLYDDHDIRQVLLDRLQSWGYSVETTVNVGQAFVALCRENFDGVLFEIETPRVEDLSALLQLRTTHPAMPVMMVTGWPDLERLIRVVVGEGQQVYLHKPFDAAQLQKAVELCFGPSSRCLQDARANTKQLSGLLPICSSCKKIRDDKGRWHPVEVYVRDHSEADFTHGICPECLDEIYPA